MPSSSRAARSVALVSVMASTSCNAILGVQTPLEILCEDGADCDNGFCGSDARCDRQQWVRRFGDGADDTATALVHVVQGPSDALDESDGGSEAPQAEPASPRELTIVAGTYQGQLDLGDGQVLTNAGGRDGFVAALDEFGQTVWTLALRGTAEQTPAVMTYDGDESLYVAGTFDGRFEAGSTSLMPHREGASGFLLKIDMSGEAQWARSFAVREWMRINDLITVSSLPVIVGDYRGAWLDGPLAEADPGLSQAGFALLYRADGSEGQSAALGSSADLGVCCANVEPASGALLLGGGYEGTLITADGSVDAVGLANGFIIAASTTDGAPPAIELPIVGLEDPLVAMNFDGQQRLAMGVIGSETLGTAGLSVLRLRDSGIADLVRADAPEGTFELATLTHTPEDTTIAFGSFRDRLDFVNGPTLLAEGRDLFLAVIDAQWDLPGGQTRAFEGDGSANPAGLAVAADGALVFAGAFDGTLNIDNAHGAVPLQSAGQGDIFVARILP